MKQSRLRPKSPKRATLDRTAGPWRRAFILEIGQCEDCGCGELARLSIHEISQGAGRKASLTERCAILVLCDGFASNCHAKIHGLGKAGKVRALALLWLARPEDWNLERVWELRRDNWPELSEVVSEATNILKERGQVPR